LAQDDRSFYLMDFKRQGTKTGLPNRRIDGFSTEILESSN
jgi:hypothetical protein